MEEITVVGLVWLWLGFGLVLITYYGYYGIPFFFFSLYVFLCISEHGDSVFFFSFAPFCDKRDKEVQCSATNV